MATPEVRCPKCGARNRVPTDARGKPRCGKCQRDLPWLVNLDGSQFSATIESSTLPVLVDLWAPWCGPCRMVAPALVELSNDLAGSLRIVKVDVDQAPDISAQLGVQGIPTMLLFNDGVEISRQVGARPKDAIRRWLDETLASSAETS